MKTANDVFAAAMALMDELDKDGNALTSDTAEYEKRTPGILTALVSEFFILTGVSKQIPVEQMDDSLLGVPDVYALGVLHYGLAANLLTDENPTAASFYEQRYEELRDRYVTRMGAADGEIVDLYGGIEYGQFSRW